MNVILIDVFHPVPEPLWLDFKLEVEKFLLPREQFINRFHQWEKFYFELEYEEI